MTFHLSMPVYTIAVSLVANLCSCFNFIIAVRPISRTLNWPHIHQYYLWYAKYSTCVVQNEGSVCRTTGLAMEALCPRVSRIASLLINTVGLCMPLGCRYSPTIYVKQIFHQGSCITVQVSSLIMKLYLTLIWIYFSSSIVKLTEWIHIFFNFRP